MSNNSRFKWVENFADNEWYLIDTDCGNLVLFEILYCVQKLWLCVDQDKHIMGNKIIEDWDVNEYISSKGKLEDENFTFYQDADQHTAKSFLHAKNIVNQRMKNRFGKRWKEE